VVAAHVAGVPVEELLPTLPVLLLAASAGWAATRRRKERR
jgi:hypothetical protein